MLDHVPSERALRALRGMTWGPPRAIAYQRFLETWGLKVYTASSISVAAGHGLLPTRQALRDYTASIKIEARNRVSELAGAHARSIISTHDAMLTRRATTIAEEHPSWPWSAIRASLIAYDDRLAAWKAQQVDETERFAFYQAAFEDFYRDNSDRGALFDFGGSLQCEACQEIAGSNPYTLSAMIEVDDPPHPGCLDIWSAAG
jgi:hypothetical protein